MPESRHLRLNRPVSYVFTREESIQQSHKRHGIRTHIRLGADHTGILTALEARAVMDGGAYVNESPIVTWKSTNCGAGPYRFPAVYYENKGRYDQQYGLRCHAWFWNSAGDFCTGKRYE